MTTTSNNHEKFYEEIKAIQEKTESQLVLLLQKASKFFFRQPALVPLNTDNVLVTFNSTDFVLYGNPDQLISKYPRLVIEGVLSGILKTFSEDSNEDLISLGYTAKEIEASFNFIVKSVIYILSKVTNNSMIDSSYLDISSTISSKILSFAESITSKGNVAISAAKFVSSDAALLEELSGDSNVSRVPVSGALNIVDIVKPLEELYTGDLAHKALKITNVDDFHTISAYSLELFVVDSNVDLLELYDDETTDSEIEKHLPINLIPRSVYTKGESTGSRSEEGDGSVLSGSVDSSFNTLSFLNEIEKLVKTNPALLKLLNIVNAFKFSILSAMVNYEASLNSIFDGIFKNDVTERPNPRYLTLGLIAPSPVALQTNLAFWLDHSGSISERGSDIQLGAIDAVIEKYPNVVKRVGFFSTTIHNEHILGVQDSLIDSLELIGSDAGGKGGTDFNAVYQYVEENYSDEELSELSMLAIVSDDGAGGEVRIQPRTLELFKGRYVFLFGDCQSSHMEISNLTEYFTQINLLDRVDFAIYKLAGKDNPDAVGRS